MRTRLRPAFFAVSVLLTTLLWGPTSGCSRGQPSNVATSTPKNRVAPTLPPPTLQPAPTVEPAAASLPVALTPNQQSRRTPVVDAVQRTGPSVVSIFTEQKPQYNPFGFFGLQEDDESGRTSLGSGVIVDPRGLVVTNEHVVAGAARECEDFGAHTPHSS